MTVDTPIESEVAEAAETLSISDPSLSFSDYEKVRRGESVPKVQSVKPSAPGAEKALEQKESPASGTEETEGEGENENEAEGDESSDETEAKEEAKDQPRKKGGFQRRIDKLNARYAQAQAEIEYLRKMAETAGTRKTEPKAESPKVDVSSDKPKADDFETHADYVEALTDWKVDQKEKAREERDQKSKLEADHKKQVKTYVERREAFQAKTPDFDEVMEEAEGIRLSPAVESLLLESENGPDLAYELAKNKDDLKRICALAPLAAAREIGKIETRLSHAPSAAKTETPKKITKAPKPLETVRSGKGTVAKTIDDPNLSFAEYEKMRREQLKRKTRA